MGRLINRHAGVELVHADAGACRDLLRQSIDHIDTMLAAFDDAKTALKDLQAQLKDIEANPTEQDLKSAIARVMFSAGGGDVCNAVKAIDMDQLRHDLPMALELLTGRSNFD